MSFLAILALNGASDGGMRVVLLLLLLVAIVLLLVGGMLAVFTFLKQRKGQTAHANESTGE
jgi:flagellar basal body-associated protein FliL